MVLPCVTLANSLGRTAQKINSLLLVHSLLRVLARRPTPLGHALREVAPGALTESETQLIRYVDAPVSQPTNGLACRKLP